jgi:site-specific recombinase XerD/ribosomal protein L40E
MQTYHEKEDLAYSDKLYREIMSNPGLNEKNRAYVEQHLTHIRAQSLNIRSVVRHLYGIKKLLEGVGPGKDLKTVTRQEIEKAAANVISDPKHYSEDTVVHFFSVWKVFYKWLIGDGIYYPPCVAALKCTVKNKKKLIPEDLLTEQEVLKMLGSARDIRDRFFLSLLYETGCRIGEIMWIRKKDIDLASQPAKVIVTGKTGWRKIPMILSVPLAAEYLNTIKDLKDDQPIWVQIGTSKNKDEPMTYDGARKMLKILAEKAGITKRVNPHSFRKARASHLANKLSDQQLRAYFGWDPASDMANVYIRLSGKDLDSAYMKSNGLEVKEERIQPLLKVKECGRCKFSNSIDAGYCTRCGTPLDEKLAVEVQNRETDMNQAIAEALKDPKAIEEIVHAYLLMQAKKGKK